MSRREDQGGIGGGVDAGKQVLHSARGNVIRNRDARLGHPLPLRQPKKKPPRGGRRVGWRRGRDCRSTSLRCPSGARGPSHSLRSFGSNPCRLLIHCLCASPRKSRPGGGRRVGWRRGRGTNSPHFCMVLGLWHCRCKPLAQKRFPFVVFFACCRLVSSGFALVGHYLDTRQSGAGASGSRVWGRGRGLIRSAVSEGSGAVRVPVWTPVRRFCNSL